MSKKLGVRSEEYKVKSTAFQGLAKWFEAHKPKGKWAWLESTLRDCRRPRENRGCAARDAEGNPVTDEQTLFK